MPGREARCAVEAVLGEMPKPVWAFHQNTPGGEAVPLDMAKELNY